MLDFKFGLALLLVLVMACAAPPMSKPSATFSALSQATLTTTATPTRPVTKSPSPRQNVPTPTRRAKKKPKATPTPFTPDTLYAIEPLRVIRHSPEADATNIGIERTALQLRAQFNYPMVPLRDVNVSNVLTQPLKIEPALPGVGYWENSFTYVYSPTVDMAIATKYKIAVKPISDTLGHSSKAYQWSFETIPPQIERYAPAYEKNVLPDAQLEIGFNTAMNRAAVEARFHLRRLDSKTDLAGKFEWRDQTMQFIPAQKMERGGHYRALLDAGAVDVNQRGALNQALDWTFEIIPPFDLIDTQPRAGEKEATSIRDNVAGFLISFSAPVEAKDVHVSVAPKLAQLRVVDYGWDETQALIWGDWRASTAYTVTLHADTRDRGGALLGREVIAHFSTAPTESQLYVSLPDFSIQDAHRPFDVFVTHSNVPRVRYALYRIPRARLFDLLHNSDYDYASAVDHYKPDAADLFHEWSDRTPEELDVARVLRTTAHDADGASPPPDIYFLDVTAEKNLRDRSLVLYSPYQLAFKHTDRDALIWATNLQTGKPVSQMPLNLYTAQGKLIAQGKTDFDGIWRVNFELDKRETRQNRNDGNLDLLVLAEQNNRIVAAVSSRWNDGISAWDFDLPVGRVNRFRNIYFANVYTDRPVYRAGQSVYFKGIVRRALANQLYAVPTAYHELVDRHDPDLEVPAYEPLKKIGVTIYNARGDEISRQQIALSKFGTFDGNVPLSENAPTGYYSIQTEYGAVNFLVAQYRRPEFQVEVASAQPTYINGDTMQFEIASSYLFGGPVANANVTWRLLRENLYPQPDIEGQWDFGAVNPEVDYAAEGTRAGLFREGTTQTDAAGKLHLDIPADLSEMQAHQKFTLEAEVLDLNHQVITARATVPVYQGAFMLGLKPQTYVAQANKRVAADLIAIATRDENAGSASTVMANEPISVSVFLGEWYSTREKVSGVYEWKSVYKETRVDNLRVTTDERGRANITFTPRRGGTYRIAAEGRDAKGNRIASSTRVWVTADDFIGWRVPNNHRIELIANQKEYAPGDTAELIVLAPYADAEAILTIERDSILSAQRIKLQGNSPRLAIKIPETYAPNVFVSLMLVKGRGENNSTFPQFHVAYKELKVKTVAQELNVHLTAECAAQKENKGMAENSVCRPNDMATISLYATDYLSRPVQAEFSLALVDKAVHLLSDDAAKPLRQTFFFERGLGVNTAGSLLKFAEEETRNIQTGVKGGGGGGGDIEFSVRRNFQDTGYWNPRVLTDENGRAQVQMRLPDNLTTWQVTAKGVTRDTRLGQARAEFISTRALLVRPVTPRFAVVGDKLRLEAVVNNNASRALTATISLYAPNLDLLNYAPQTLTIPAQQAARVGWDAKIPFGERAVFTFTVMAGKYFDAVETALPIQYPTSVTPLADLTPIEKIFTHTLTLPRDTEPNSPYDRVEIQLTPSLAAASRASLDYLQHFGWECSEQTTSKFLPNVATYLAMRRLGIERPDLRDALQDNITREIQRLYELQNNDGGWGWWANGASRPLLTAYALWGLDAARRANFAVDDAVSTRAKNNLYQVLDEKRDRAQGWEFNERAFVLFVLTEMGEPTTGRVLNVYEQRASLALYGKALLLMAMQKLQLPQAETLAQELRDAAVDDAAGAHWREASAEPDYWTMNTDTRTTAMVIMALSRMGRDGIVPPIPQAVRRLMSARKFDHWESTQETAWSVMALTEFMLASGELQGNYNYQVKWNNETIGAGNVNAHNLEATQSLTIAVKKLLEQTANTLSIERDALNGTLYYSANLLRYERAADIPAQNRGVALVREYYAVDPLTLQPTTQRVTSAKLGEYVQVRIAVVASKDLYYLALEDMLPAGLEAIDTTLKTSSQAAQSPQLDNAGAEYNYWWYWGHSEIRDDRVALFADWLPRGSYEYTYLARASIAGEYNVLPSRVWQMYYPATYGQSAGGTFSVMNP